MLENLPPLGHCFLSGSVFFFVGTKTSLLFCWDYAWTPQTSITA